MSTADRGFASMAKMLQRAIASRGGTAAHAQGVAHQWTRHTAREAGRKGGLARAAARRARAATK